MKILLLNQTFYPDVVSTAQHLTDLALGLVERGHEVTVISSRRAYDRPDLTFPKEEHWRGIRILRVSSTGLGKGARWRRAADFATFTGFCALRLAFMRRADVVVALTSPPLISFLGAWVAKVRRSRFVYWVMDFNPDEAIASGWLRPKSPAARVLEGMSRFSLNRADRVVALDNFMRDRIKAKGIEPSKILVIPPWSHESEVRFDQTGRTRFRQANGLDGKFVVMYSGNHSPCHPLDTLIEAARRLANDPQVAFCFVGGGSEFLRVRQIAEQERLANVTCLPYQPLSQLSASLSAADLHVVVMGDAFVGLVHPCKIYNILSVAAPVLYIGPRPSHLTVILDAAGGEPGCATVAHHDVNGVLREIGRFRREPVPKERLPAALLSRFTRQTVLPKLIAELESGPASTPRSLPETLRHEQ